MTTASTTWRTTLVQQLQTRYQLETTSKRHVDAYAKLIKKYMQNATECGHLQQQVKMLEDNNRLLVAENNAMKSSPDQLVKAAEGAQVSAQKVREYEQKILELHEELTSAYKQKAENAQAVLDLQMVVKNNKADLQKRTKEFDDADNSSKLLTAQVEDLQQKLERKNNAVELLNTEIKLYKVCDILHVLSIF